VLHILSFEIVANSTDDQPKGVVSAVPQRKLGLHVTVHANMFELDVDYEGKGTIRKEHDLRSVARFS